MNRMAAMTAPAMLNSHNPDTMADWQSSLQAFLDNNPDLPQGEEAAAPAEKPAAKPRLEIIYERKGRAGKPATIIAGFGDTPDDVIESVARRIKTTIGTGGSVRGGEILVQGDRREAVRRILTEMGYRC